MKIETEQSLGLIKIAQILLVCTIGISAYLAYQSLTGSQIAGCGPEDGCGKVLLSKWSSILTVPVSIPGIILYLTLLITVQTKNIKYAAAGFISTTAAITIIAGALWFTAVQMYLIKSFCKYCCTAHLMASIASLLVLLKIYGDRIRPPKTSKVEVNLPARNTGSRKQREKKARQLAKQQAKATAPTIIPDTSEIAEPNMARLGKEISFLPAAITGLALVGISIGLQTFGTQKDMSQEVTVGSSEIPESPGDNQPGPVTKENTLIAPFRKSDHDPLQIAVTGGLYTIPSKTVPQETFGNTDPDKVKNAIQLAYLYDWTCDHCRALHKRLHELKAEGNPFGLEDAYTVSYLPSAYENEGRYLHQLMFAAWMEDRNLHEALAQEMYDGSLSPTQQDVRARAVELTGNEQKWISMLTKNNFRYKRAKELSASQGAHNEEKVQLELFPQLTAINTAITGVPNDKSLKSFLVKAAETQKRYLESPPEGLTGPVLFPFEDIKKAQEAAKNRPTPPKVKPPKRNGAKIEFDQVEITAEPILSGEIGSGTFHFTNTGTEPLEIYKLKTGCGCTTSQGWKQTVSPGEKGQITVNYNSKGKSPYGTHPRSIWITSSASNYDDKPNGDLYGNQVKLLVPIKNADGSPATQPKSKPPVKTIQLNKPADHVNEPAPAPTD